MKLTAINSAKFGRLLELELKLNLYFKVSASCVSC